MTARPKPLPLPVRLMNWAGGLASRFGWQVVDLYFQDFIKDQVGTVRRATEHFSLEFPAAARMQAFLDASPSDEYGRHLYSFVDIGMDLEKTRAMLRNYRDCFDIPSESV